MTKYIQSLLPRTNYSIQLFQNLANRLEACAVEIITTDNPGYVIARMEVEKEIPPPLLAELQQLDRQTRQRIAKAQR